MPSGATTRASGVMEKAYQPIETGLESSSGLLAVQLQGTGLECMLLGKPVL